MKYLVLMMIFAFGVNAYSQTDTKPASDDKKEVSTEELNQYQLKKFKELLKEAKWVEVASAEGAGTFYVDKVSALRKKNDVQFVVKIDKRGNLDFTKMNGDCQNDVYQIEPWTFKQEVGDELQIIDNTKSKNVLAGVGIAKAGTVIYAVLEAACREGIKPSN